MADTAKTLNDDECNMSDASNMAATGDVVAAPDKTVEEARTRKGQIRKSERVRKPKKEDAHSIDGMNIVQLKEQLRKLNLATTGNKNELKCRLRPLWNTKSKNMFDNAKDCNATPPSEDGATIDEESSDEDVIDKVREVKRFDARRKTNRRERERVSNSESEIDNDNHAPRSRNIDRRRKTNCREWKRSSSSESETDIDNHAPRTHDIIRTKSKRRERERLPRSDSEEDSDHAGSRARNEGGHRNHMRNNRATDRGIPEHARSNFTIRDVEESLSYFSGDDKLSVIKWILDFEDMSALLQWSDLQKLIYGKRMLTGSAKQFISFEKGVTTWELLKKHLTKEFKVEVNSATIHSQLFKRRRKPEENGRQYIYAMREIADQGLIEEDALMQYVIDGIQDDECNKTVLYSARTMRELKKCFEIYDRMKEKTQYKKRNDKKDKTKDSTKDFKSRKSAEKRHCFNCGSTEHELKSCNFKDKGPKCFKCNDFGHVASKCSQSTQSQTRPIVISCIHHNDRSIPVEISGSSYRALVDTGSDVNLMRADVYESIGQPMLINTTCVFTGLGNIPTKPIGVVNLDLIIRGDDYVTQVFIVPVESMTSQLILGRELLDQAEVIIRKGKITMQQMRDQDATVVNEQTNTTAIDDHENNVGYRELAVMNCIAINEVDVAEPYRSRVEAMIEKHQPKENVETTIQTKIVVKDEIPICMRPRRLAPKERKVLNDQIQEWLDVGIIRPSKSEYSSPVVIVRKKDGSSRVCIDYRMLNKKIIRDRYPMPLIDDQIDALANYKVFSVIDLKNGFFHVPVTEESRKYTSFVTPDGQYEFTRTPFGLCNSPTNFLRFIGDVFKDLIRRSVVLTYMDDLIVPGLDHKSAFCNLEETLKVAAENGLQINWK